MEVSPELKTLIFVEDVYPRHRLFAQGIHELLALTEAGTDTAQVHRLLGDYFIRSGLEGPTEASYLRTLEQAKVYLTAAQEGATALGDADLLAKIQAELGDQ